MKTIEVFEQRPESFSPIVEVSGCYLENQGKSLFLLNGANDNEPGRWGVPAGKLLEGERPVRGALRELFEETFIVVAECQMESVGSLYIRKPGFDYVYHMFRVRVEGEVDVRLSEEHEGFRWVSDVEIEELPLVGGAREAYEWFKRVMR